MTVLIALALLAIVEIGFLIRWMRSDGAGHLPARPEATWSDHSTPSVPYALNH